MNTRFHLRDPRPTAFAPLPIWLSLAVLMLSLTACQPDGQDQAKNTGKDKQKNLPVVTLQAAVSRTVALTQESVGTLESIIDPTIAAEVAGRVLEVTVHPGQSVKKGQRIATIDATDNRLQMQASATEIGRIEALQRNQEKQVARYQTLVDKNFISRNALDDALAQLEALQQQLAAAKSHVASIAYTGSKHLLYAPTDGVVETQIVSKGDYVKIGDPVVKLINNSRLRAHLPFPEQLATSLKPGLPLILTTPASSQPVETVIRDIHPLIKADSRALDVTADIINQPDWQPGGSVRGKVVLGSRDHTVLVPEQSVVLRPAGEVVYVIKAGSENNRVQQRIVKTGVTSEGMIEVVEGLSSGEKVVVDGAGFLTDDAKVQLQSPINQNDGSAGKQTHQRHKKAP